MNQITSQSWDDKISDLVEKISHMPYDSIISYMQLENILGISKNTVSFQYVLSKVKVELISFGIVLKTLINEGYRILMPKEIASEVLRKYGGSIIQKLTMGNTILNYVDKSSLSLGEVEELNACSKLFNNLLEYNFDKIKSTHYMLYNTKIKEIGE